MESTWGFNTIFLWLHWLNLEPLSSRLLMIWKSKFFSFKPLLVGYTISVAKNILKDLKLFLMFLAFPTLNGRTHLSVQKRNMPITHFPRFLHSSEWAYHLGSINRMHRWQTLSQKPGVQRNRDGAIYTEAGARSSVHKWQWQWQWQWLWRQQHEA